MLKSVQLGPYLLRPEDFEVVTSFFRAIGFGYHVRVVSQVEMITVSEGALHLTVRELLPEEAKPTSRDSDALSLQIALEVSNPEVVRDIAERRKLAVETSNSQSGGGPDFRVELPGKLFVYVSRKTDEHLGEQGTYQARGKRFAIVVSRFNAFITERLLSGALDALSRTGASTKNTAVVWVPGAFEIPGVARTLAASKKYDAVICLGCLLRGDTAHYDVIANEVSRGIGQSAQETGVPHAFGVLTCETLEQAIDRAGLKMGNKGFEAALSAIEMANLTKAIASGGPSALGKGKAIRAKVVRRRRPHGSSGRTQPK
jgi:6,7-dimethyl-8-ribityllumazine synthase